jgi:hypothetical protein
VPSVRSRSPPDLVPGCVDDAARSGHELKRACADSNGDLARGATPQRALNRQSSSQDLGTTARSFAAVMGNGTIVTRSVPVSCGGPTPVLTSAFGGVGVGVESVDVAEGSVVSLGAGAMSAVFDSTAGGEVSVEGGGEVSVDGGGEVSVEGGGEVSVEGGGAVSVEGGGAVSVEGGGAVSVEGGGGGVEGSVAADWVSAETGDGSVGAGGGSCEGVGSGEAVGGFVAAPPEAGAGSSARAVPTNAEAAREAATKASAHPRGLSDRRRRLGIRLLRTTTHLLS